MACENTPETTPWTDVWGNVCSDPTECPDCSSHTEDPDNTCFRCGGERKICAAAWPHTSEELPA
jgi:hypothetical protein